MPKSVVSDRLTSNIPASEDSGALARNLDLDDAKLGLLVFSASVV
jgi:hypothetical protein